MFEGSCRWSLASQTANPRAALGRLLAGAHESTHACVRMTAIDAYQHDYPVYVITDCVGSYDLEHHEVTLRYIDGKIGTVLAR